MNTFTANLGHFSKTAVARPTLRPLPESTTGRPATTGSDVKAGWLERLATWYAMQPRHRRLGNYTLLMVPAGFAADLSDRAARRAGATAQG